MNVDLLASSRAVGSTVVLCVGHSRGRAKIKSKTSYVVSREEKKGRTSIQVIGAAQIVFLRGHQSRGNHAQTILPLWADADIGEGRGMEDETEESD